jgi:hypothetical protein
VLGFAAAARGAKRANLDAAISGTRKRLHYGPVRQDIGGHVDFMLGAIDQGNADVFQVFRGRVVKGRRRIGGAWRERCEQETSRNAGAHSRPCASYLVIDDICGALFDLCAQILVVRVVETKPPLLDLKPSIKLVYFGLCEALGVFHGKHSLLFLSSGACCARRSAGGLRARRSAISPLNGSPR